MREAQCVQLGSKKIRMANDKLSTNWQETHTSYIGVYMNHFVKKFRKYNNDEFIITIADLNKFIDNGDIILTYLFEQFKQYNFHIEFIGKADSINQICVDYRNITKNKTDNLQYQIQDLINIVELSNKTDIPIVGIFIMKIVAQIIIKTKTLYKAIVLDLDDTLWSGTLSEIGIDNIEKRLSSEQGIPFIAFMKFCKILANELGIFIAICSRNNSEEVENAIKKLPESIFPLKNQIDLLIANNNDKSENIKKIAEELSILSDSIVFIDDNQIVRDEVRNELPNIFVPEWSNHEDLLTQLIIGCTFDRNDLSLNSKNRRKQYKTIQIERTKNFLPELSIKIINDDNHIESNKLYSKSNQFKFSGNDDNFERNAKSFYFDIYRENGENLGICSAITYTTTEDTLVVTNWAVSCRYFQIGVEEFILLYLAKVADNKKIVIIYQQSEYNSKIKELLKKYADVFKKNGQGNTIKLEFTEVKINNIKNNTRLKEINYG